jgi:hypothetical protein
MKMTRVRLRIHRRGGPALREVLVALLLPVVLPLALTLNRVRATVPGSASSTSATLGVRQFYLTKSAHNGVQAPTACVKGYHFASIWELADPSALEYNVNLGRTASDGGAGPPTQLTGFGYSIPARGWVRTGYASHTGGTAGRGNCEAWSSDSDSHWGTVANLPSDWLGGEQDAGLWNADVRACNTFNRVWCVQDDSVWRVFLPLALSND